MERRELLATFIVKNTDDDGPDSLRRAIVNANANPGRDSIVFDIKASTAPNLDVPVPGFDPISQTWTIRPVSPLPVIADSVVIDGFSQAHSPVQFLYPGQMTNTVQVVSLLGSPTGGTFTLSTVAPWPVDSTAPIPYDASAATVLARLNALLGVGNVMVEGGPAPGSSFTITLTGSLAHQNWPALVPTSNLTGGTLPSVDVTKTVSGGVPISDPKLITSTPSTLLATAGNDAHNRVIIDGSLAGGTAFVLDTTDSILRGLVITNFDRGVDVPNASNIGNRIQGNFIGKYVVYLVDPQTGNPLPGLSTQQLVGVGNAQEGIRSAGSNTYIGGTTAQEANVITANGGAGISLLTTALGSQVYNNQVGIIGPTALGRFYTVPNGGDGVLVASSSNLIGTTGAGNLISGNIGSGVHLSGAGATRNVLVGNLIGAPPGGALVLGQGNTGNQGHGVWIDNNSDNRLGGPALTQRNVISRNWQDGVRIEGALAVRNVLINNFIGVDSSGGTILGNSGSGVGLYSAQNTVGPDNVITANLRGVLISGPSATGNLVTDNKIGTDSTGQIDLGNALEGVRIELAAAGNTISGNGQGSQVISGNNVGVAIVGAGSSSNTIQGNYIGVNVGGDTDDDNSIQGVLIDEAAGNLIGGAGPTYRNVISANHYGIEIRNPGAISNTIQGNSIGTDATGQNRLGSELDGIIIHLGASNNTIGGNSTAAGNRIGFNLRDGVRIEDDSVGNTILTNSIFQNIGLGIDLVGPLANRGAVAPILASVASSPTFTRIRGSFAGSPNASYTLQFFANPTLAETGGRQYLGQAVVTTDGTGAVSFTADVAGLLLPGQYVTATATSSLGDTSRFAGPITEQSGTVQFDPASYTVVESAGVATITLTRTGGSGGYFSVNYTTGGGTAVPYVNYMPVLGSLAFQIDQNTATFTVPIVNNSTPSINVFAGLILSNPVGAISVGTPATATLTILGTMGSSSLVVTNTNDSGPGSLRQAILNANASAGPDVITFRINASNAINLDVPVSGFDPATQTWTIRPLTPLPAITDPVTIDGYSQAHSGVLYRYPEQSTSTVQAVSLLGLPTGGTFTLSTVAPLPVGTTAPIRFDATEAMVQSSLEAILGVGNVKVVGSPAGIAFVTLTGALAGKDWPLLAATSNLTGGVSPTVSVTKTTQGGVPITDPRTIASSPSTFLATAGNDAHVRVIIDGSLAGGAGFVIDTSNSILRGLAIANFVRGVDVPNASNVGNRIQGNFIGSYVVYPVDPQTGIPLTGLAAQQLVNGGNAQEGIRTAGSNTYIGGATAQEANVISGNGGAGISLLATAVGSQVYNNQVGIVGPTSPGLFYTAANGGDGVLVASSSNLIGAAGAGNLISGNAGAGVHVQGPSATRNRIQGNFIGAPPGGALLLGMGSTGNRGPGVWLENASDNWIGGPDDLLRNVIARNLQEGVRVEGVSGVRNQIQNNYIGVDVTGSGILGNTGDGVAIYSALNVVGPSNVISANNRGVLISGGSAVGNVVQGNRIGSDAAGRLDLGNAHEGVRIELGATGTQVLGDGQGSQVISGNNQGVAIVGPVTTGTLVAGNYIGTDASGTADLANSLEGIQIDGSPNNTIGGVLAAQRNLISGNHWGIVIVNSGATNNVVQGNFIGTNAAGTGPLGNELDGVWILLGASNNTIGGPISTPGAGNRIGFNIRDGIRIEDSSVGNAVLTNGIFQNVGLGIDLVGPLANRGAVAPTLASVASSPSFTRVKGSLAGSPNASYTLQFFANTSAAETGGQRFLGQLVATANAAGIILFTADVAGLLLPGQYVTATATSTLGDTSRFAGPITELAGTVQFNPASYTVLESDGAATIQVTRTGGSGGYFSVNYTTGGGTAVPYVNYTPVSGTLVFQIDQNTATFTVPIVNNSTPSINVFAGMTLVNPVGAIALGSPATATLTILGTMGSSSLVVTNTNDDGPGSLRQAILNANASAGPDVITFRINASNATNLNVPVSGFDPITQTWTITLVSPLPSITDPVTLDGLSQGASPVLYRYPSQLTTAVQSISVLGGPTGGSFTLSRPDTGQETLAIPYNATAATVQALLRQIYPVGVRDGITVSGGPAPVNPFSVTFGGMLAGQAVPTLLAASMLSGGSSPTTAVATTTEGGIPIGNPTSITSKANDLAATLGYNAVLRIIVNGGLIDRGLYPNPVGLSIATSQSLVSGLMIQGFDVGVAIAGAGASGNRVQGNVIGSALLATVDPQTGAAVPGAAGLRLSLVGNASWGVLLSATNATIGGSLASESNVIAGNGLGGVWIQPSATGNQVLGNQIGLIGPGASGLFAYAPNGGDGIRVQSSSNTIGGVLTGSGNLIASNRGNGLTIQGISTTRNRVLGNVIGLAPVSGVSIATGSSGNLGDGISIQGAPSNTIGGDGASLRNVISGNFGAGVRVSGASATNNQIANNIIGLDALGSSVRGNGQQGVVLLGPGTTVGPNNVISGNRQGVLISGPSATGNLVADNKIGTNLDGTFGLGNAFEGVRIDNGAQSNTVRGNGQGSQVISGNNQGVAIVGAATAFNAIVGNYIGTDASGTADLANSLEGIRIDGAPANTIGGTTSAQRNLISANHWGVVIANPGATNNVVQGNFIGTNAAGTGPLGNELDGVWVLLGASSNTIGGAAASQGNRIAFNVRDGVRIEDDSVGNAILSNAIYQNGGLGIDLVSPPGHPNNLQPAPVLTALATSLTFTRIQGTQTGSPNTPYTIQFFTTGSIGAPQGGTYLGQVIARTDASGVAYFTADVPGTVPTGQAVTATATDPFGNTSTFATPITEVLGVTEFSMAGFTVNQDAGKATITVVRFGGSGGYFSVDYATIGGTAQPGVDYRPASGTLVFSAGVNSLTFDVPILNTGLPGATLTVLLGLSHPVGAASLGSPSTATLSILNTNQPGIASFSTSTFVTMANSGSATVTVVRSSGGSTVSVRYATMDGTARAGVNYVATSGVLTFGPGETSKTFTVPILFDPRMGSQVALGLNLTSPTGGLGIGPPNPANLVIQYVSSPRVTRLQPIAGGGGINGILISFSEPLDPARAVDPRNYGYTVRTPGRDGKLGNRDDVLIGIRSYRYDPAKQAVTLLLARAVPKGTPIRVTINQVTNVASAGVGVANLQGTLLQGNNNPGLPGGVFIGDVKGKAVVVPAGPAALARKLKRSAGQR